MLAARLAKLVMVSSLACLALIVTFDKVYDYDANFSFVRHVLSMDTTFQDEPLMGRAITDPALWRLSYACIILGEGLTAAAFTGAAIQLARNLLRDASRFRRSKWLVFVGAALGFLVWFFGFMVIGGEWFAMW